MSKGTIIVIGFGPYAKLKSNMSGKIAKSLNGISFNGYDIKAHILPVDYMTLQDTLGDILKKSKPKIVLIINSTQTNKILLENTSKNHLRGFYNDTSVPPQKILRQLAPDYEYPTTLPLKAIHEALTIDKVKSKINKKPSDFVGNQAFFYCMHLLKHKKDPIPAGLIRIPDKNQSLIDLISVFDRILKEIIDIIEKEKK